ncbi:MAG: hypothetical protein WEB51_05855 [Mycobacterium sp.]
MNRPGIAAALGIGVALLPGTAVAGAETDGADSFFSPTPPDPTAVGYSGIVGDTNYKQFPRGGPLGLGLLPPLPFGLFQNGLLGLVGFGPAYRDASFLLANTHLRTEARDTLLTDMLKKRWLTKAVIALGSLWGMAPVRSARAGTEPAANSLAA